MKKHFSHLVAILAAIMLMPSMVVAQDDGPGYLQVRTMVVKPSRIGDYLALQAEFAAADKAADNSRNFWQEVRGDSSTFYAVRTLDKLGDNDDDFQPPMDPDDWSMWVSKFQDTISSSTYQILRTFPELTIPPEEGAELNLLLLRYSTVATGRNADYSEWVENSLLPAISGSGMTGVNFIRMYRGGNPNTWISSTPYKDWSAMDAPGVFSHMSDEDRNAMFAKSRGMVVSSEVTILGYMSELSY